MDRKLSHNKLIPGLYELILRFSYFWLFVMKYPLKFKRNGHKAERIFVHSKSRGGQESGNENVGINLLWLN
jgi:hypothetical protein